MSEELKQGELTLDTQNTVDHIVAAKRSVELASRYVGDNAPIHSLCEGMEAGEAKKLRQFVGTMRKHIDSAKKSLDDIKPESIHYE